MRVELQATSYTFVVIDTFYSVVFLTKNKGILIYREITGGTNVTIRKYHNEQKQPSKENAIKILQENNIIPL